MLVLDTEKWALFEASHFNSGCGGYEKLETCPHNVQYFILPVFTSFNHPFYGHYLSFVQDEVLRSILFLLARSCLAQPIVREPSSAPGYNCRWFV